MKKILLIALVIIVLGGTYSHARGLAIGGAFGIPAVGSLPMGVLLSVKIPQIPFLLGIGYSFNAGLGVTADWWLYQSHLVGILNLYVGPGLYLNVSNSFQLGVRVPIGIQIWPITPLELFLEVAPTVGFIEPTGVQIPSFGLQGSVGFRFWF